MNNIFDILDDAPDGMITPAGDHIFQVNEQDPIFLNEMVEVEFHHIVARLLFLCNRVRPDLQTAVSFFCTRLKNPDTNDHKKISRVLKYLRTTAGLPLILGMGGTNTVSWWVDEAFAIYNYMKSDAGAYMSLGIGAAYAISSKQKLNMRSSTEAELIVCNTIRRSEERRVTHPV